MYYIVYAFFYLFSLLPFWVIHRISDWVFVILYYIVRYRRKVVAANLAIAFPEKTEKERAAIAKQFYRGFTDNFLETLKLISMSKNELNRHFTCDYSLIHDLYAQGYKLQIHTGHFFNWELGNAACSMNVPYPFLAVYMPIQSKIVDRLFYTMRKRFGAILIPKDEFKKAFLAYAKQPYALILAADQNAGNPEKAFWVPFFDKMVPVMTGPEKGGMVNNTAIVMGKFFRTKRGYYHCKLELLTKEASTMPKGAITHQTMAFVEQAIREHPDCYLWSHRRWKWTYDEAKYGHLVV